MKSSTKTYNKIATLSCGDALDLQVWRPCRQGIWLPILNNRNNYVNTLFEVLIEEFDDSPPRRIA